MKYLFSCLLLSMLCTISVAQPVKEAPIKNPMLWADVPDPDVIRVGDTFYLVSTTMHLMPGAPVMASKDLKNWKTVSYIFDKLTDSPKYDLSFSLPLDQQKGEGVGTVYGRGQWATSLKFHNGKFWALLAPNEQGAMGDTYIFTAPKAEGPWTIHARMRHFHDATLFFDDDGTPYVFFGTGEMCQLTPDLKGVVEGSLRHYFQREKEETGLLEGTRVIKHRGTYYAMLISQAYSSGLNRREVCYRTKDLNGKWEKHVILERDFGGFHHLAQGTIVDTEEGDWYGIMFQDRGGVGRVLTLSPVRWIDGWPILGDENYKVPEIMRPYKSGQPATSIVLPDDFDDTRLGLHWQWNHNPDNRLWSLTEREGYLRLRTVNVCDTVADARNTISQRTFGPECGGYIKLDVSEMKDGDTAGLAAFAEKYGYVAVKIEDGKKYIVTVWYDDNDDVEQEFETERVEITENEVYLRVDCDYKNAADKAYFYYSLDGENWTEIGKTLQMNYYGLHFMGYRYAIFNFPTKQSGGYVDVDYFRVENKLLK